MRLLFACKRLPQQFDSTCSPYGRFSFPLGVLFDTTSIYGISSAMHPSASEPALRSRLPEAGMQRSLAWREADFNRRFAEILDALILA